MLVAPQRSRQQLDQRACQGLHAAILVKVNPFSQQSLICATTIGREPAQSMAAQGAPALFIERKIEQKCVFEGGAATGVKELGRKRLPSAPAPGAERNARGELHGLAANAAVIREEKGKKGVEEFLNRG
jgi:hypothetical protein